jgi:hypothetical protein
MTAAYRARASWRKLMRGRSRTSLVDNTATSGIVKAIPMSAAARKSSQVACCISRECEMANARMRIGELPTFFWHGTTEPRQVSCGSFVCDNRSRISKLHTVLKQRLTCPKPDYYWQHPSGRFLSYHSAMALIADRTNMCGYEIRLSRTLSLRSSLRGS